MLDRHWHGWVENRRSEPDLENNVRDRSFKYNIIAIFL